MAKLNQSENSYKEIHRRLIGGVIEPGTRLVEQAWAQELGVNRGDIRQSFARLLAEGLVVKGARGGVFARTYDQAYVREVNEVRQILETAAAQWAIDRITPEQLDQLDAICDHMEVMGQNGYALGFAEADMRFHEVLIQATQNSKLLQVYESANLPMSPSAVKQAPQNTQSFMNDVSTHRQIVEALRHKDKDRTVELLALAWNRENHS